jgi:TatD DNase family protein
MNCFTDSHIHLAVLYKAAPAATLDWLEQSAPGCLCASAHFPEEFAVQEMLVQRHPQRIVSCYGVHPQMPKAENLIFLEKLLKENRIQAVGEMGFDLFTPEYAARIHEQEAVWKAQLHLAQEYQKTAVIHCRKGMDRLFRDARELKKLPQAVFHSWPGSPVEAESLLKRGINCFFSLGKGILNGNKRMIQSAARLPIERLLTETDAPWQTLKGEEATPPQDIEKVTAALAVIRGMDEGELKEQLYTNFRTAFQLSAQQE